MSSRTVLLAATLLVGGIGGGIAAAQNAATFDPAQLPATHGKVAQYSLTPRGDVDGVILDDGTEVHLPPFLGTELVFAVKPGDAVTVRGLRARSLPMVQAMSVANDATGTTVTDNGPGAGPRGPHDEGRQALTADSRVKAQLHGPRGDLNGALLEDGTLVRLPPPEAQRLADMLKIGAPLSVQGEGFASPLGRVIAARSIGPDAKQLVTIAAPPHHGHGMFAGMGFDHGHGHRPPPAGPDAPPAPPK